MRKSYLVAAVMFGALLVIDTMVLVTPVLAAICTVECTEGPTLTCEGETCFVDEEGCRAWEGGLLTVVRLCNPLDE